jgi:hypothetical protein
LDPFQSIISKAVAYQNPKGLRLVAEGLSSLVVQDSAELRADARGRPDFERGCQSLLVVLLFFKRVGACFDGRLLTKDSTSIKQIEKVTYQSCIPLGKTPLPSTSENDEVEKQSQACSAFCESLNLALKIVNAP